MDNNDLHENDLQVFIKNMVSSVREGDFRFVLMRWSREQSGWCVFACEFGNNNRIVTGIKETIGIGGHFCIEEKANLQDVLSILADSGWKVELRSQYFV